MIIRRAQVEDTEQMEQLHFDTINTVNAKMYTPKQREALHPKKGLYNYWGEGFNRDLFLVAEEDKLLLGFGEMTIEGVLTSLYVHKDFQGKKIGSALLKQLEASVVKGFHPDILSVNASLTAYEFYVRQGYEHVRTFKKLVRDVWIDLINMQKVLRHQEGNE